MKTSNHCDENFLSLDSVQKNFGFLREGDFKELREALRAKLYFLSSTGWAE